MNRLTLTASAPTFTTFYSTGVLQHFNKSSHLNTFSGWKSITNSHIFATHSTKTPQSSTYYTNESIKMNRHYQVEMEVQEHEVDHHGFVNDASYASYCKQGHDELLQNVGNLISDKWEDSAVTDLSVNVMEHLKKGDKFAVKVRVSCVSTRSIFIEYSMHRLQDEEVVVAMAESEMVLLDLRYSPISLSQGVRAKFLLLDFQDCCDL